MKKNLKILLVLIALVPCLVLFSACGESKSTMKRGTYKFDSIQIDGKAITIPTFDAEPEEPTKPVIYVLPPVGSKPDAGTAPTAPSYSGMTDNQKIEAQAAYQLELAEYNQLVKKAEAWQAQKDAADAVTQATKDAYTKAYEKYLADNAAYDDLYVAWVINCSNKLYDALKAAGFPAYEAYALTEPYYSSHHGYGLSDLVGTLVGAETPGLKLVVKGNRLTMVTEGFGVEFTEIEYKLNKNKEVVVIQEDMGFRIGTTEGSFKGLTYEDGKIVITSDYDDLELKIFFKK